MKYTLDTEFLENGRTIDLISIGLVAEDGREFYAVNYDAPWHNIQVHPWLMDNVVCHLPTRWEQNSAILDARSLRPDRGNAVVLDYSDIGYEVMNFLQVGLDNGEQAELWAWVSAYDHVAMCQLWGALVDRPRGIPLRTNDLQQEFERQLKMYGAPGDEKLPITQDPKSRHHALGDARFDMEIAYYLGVIERPES